MTRAFALRAFAFLFAFLALAAMLVDASPARAQSNDFSDFFGRNNSPYRGGPTYRGSPGYYSGNSGYYGGNSDYYRGGGGSVLGTGVGYSYYGGGGSYYGGGSPISREVVSAPGSFAPGTIYINTAERRLYLMLGNGQALRYGIGVGRDGFRWSGTHRVSAKREWPSWTPPREMLARRPDLPHYMPGGIENPLGARALYLGSTLYRIHGSNEPQTIGTAVSSGCFRMTNEDVVDLYSRVRVGTVVVVQN
jgi:lipoprotein-anchoring transpeptidase ErfK/SrfK